MTNHSDNNFSIPIGIMWFLVLLNWLAAFSVLFPYAVLFSSSFTYGLKTGLLFVTWVIFIADAISRARYNRTFWIIVLILTPVIAYPFYLINRKRLFNLQRKRDNFG